MRDNYNVYGVDEPVVMTFAERLYESGHDPDEAAAIAWGLIGLLYDLGVI